MTTLNTIIEEEKKTFIKFIEPALDKGFDDGYRGAEVDKAQKAYRDRYAWALDMSDFLTTAMQRAYEAGRAEERVRKEVEGMRKDFEVQSDGQYHFGENQKVIGWNQALDTLLDNLK